MNLLEILSPECIRVPLRSADKRGVIDELVDLLVETGRVNDPESLKEAVWTREQTRTTGIGHGLAIPHGKSSALSSLVMAIGKPAEPLGFEAIDGQPVHLVVLLASPPDRTSEHIQALARVSRLMTLDQFRQQVYDATSADEVYRLIQEQESA